MTFWLPPPLPPPHTVIILVRIKYLRQLVTWQLTSFFFLNRRGNKY